MGKCKKVNLREKFIQCGNFTYNKETHYVCGKSGKAWGSICGYYLLYTGLTIAGFLGMLYWMLSIMEQQGTGGLFDKQNLYKGASPALEISPKLPLYPVPILWYDQTEFGITRDHYVDYIDVFLSQYENLNESIYVDCAVEKRLENQYCKFSLEDLGPCGVANYGYDEDQPCIYLKMNKLLGWDPKKHRPAMNIDEDDRIGNEVVMVTCKALTHYDAEKLGPIAYYPGNGFHEYYFPFDGSQEYLPPLIAIQLPKLTKDFLVGIQCLTFDVDVTEEELTGDKIYIYISSE